MSAETTIKDLFVKPSKEDKKRILQNESILLDDLQIKQVRRSYNIFYTIFPYQGFQL